MHTGAVFASLLNGNKLGEMDLNIASGSLPSSIYDIALIAAAALDQRAILFAGLSASAEQTVNADRQMLPRSA